MPWGRIWLSSLVTAIETHFLATFGRELVVNKQELEKFLQTRKINSEQAAFAHFARVMTHYKSKYAFVPRFSHLVSGKIPTVEAIGWEAALYEEYPKFSPVAYVPSKSTLDGTIEYTRLFDTQRCAYFHEFASRIIEHPNPVYCFSAMFIVERLVFSLAKTRSATHDRPALSTAIAAHEVLLSKRRRSRDDNKAWRSVHFSKSLVRRQLIQFFGLYFNFWELPKLLIDSEFAGGILNCRLTPAHHQAIFDVLSKYGYENRAYLPFLIKTRDNFILRYTSQKTAWERMKPDFICEYPF